MKRYPVILVTLLVLTSISAFAQPEGPTRFDTVEFAIENTGEYSKIDGTLKVIDADSNWVQLSVPVYESELPAFTTENLKRAIVMALIVSFAHTDAADVTVTALPVLHNVETKEKTPLEDRALTLAVTREKYLVALMERLEVKTAEELVGTRKVKGEIMKDMLMGVTDRILYEDKGEPGLERFYTALY